MKDAGETEVPLEGGNASDGVVRVGDTVRKPWLPTSERTVAYMQTLRDRGVDLPQVLGRDDQGRLVLEFVPGRQGLDDAPLSTPLVRRAGTIVRRIHDASVDVPVPDDWPVLIAATEPDLVCHNDLATWNLVIDGDRLVFIDWDGAGPSTRLWDLAYAAISFGHLFPGADTADSAARLAAFVEGYGAHDRLRRALPEAMAHRARAMHDLLRECHRVGREPWALMYVEGHGEHWAGTVDFVVQHACTWREALDTGA